MTTRQDKHLEIWLPAGVAVGLALAFWWPLWSGAGFVGGDVYNYFLPLKQFYAQGLRQGEIRLWHPGIGHGIPVLGESQTGVFYPPNLVAYTFLDLVTAYNTLFLGHYLLCFIATYWLLRHLGVGRLPATLGAIVFVYGWFPPRACLEWAITTGAWMPVIVGATIRWLETGRRTSGWLMAGTVCLQLLAGHFQLAFVTVLAACIVALAWPQAGSDGSAPSSRHWIKRPTGRRALVPVYLAMGFALAAIQLVPTWELKVRSQRQLADFSETVGFGKIPLLYFGQLVAPFFFHPHGDQWLAGQSNMVEAHLYVGLFPLILVAVSAIGGAGRVRRSSFEGAVSGCPETGTGSPMVGESRAVSTRYGVPVPVSGHQQPLRPWCVLVAVGLVLASGWLAEWLAHLPGFGFFRYPGRYGLMAQLGFAVLTAIAADRCDRRVRRARLVLCAGLAATLLDLWWVGQQVQYVEAVRPAPIESLDQSEVFARLTPTDRILAPDGNILALSGAACVMPYLGMGPADYYRRWDPLPAQLFREAPPASQAVLELLRHAGITHILTERPLPASWELVPLWSGTDPFLHRVLARDPREPLHLYRFRPALGRVYSQHEDGTILGSGSIRSVQIRPHEVTIDCHSDGPCEVVLTDLAYPGWQVQVDGRPVEPATSPVPDEPNSALAWRSLFRIVRVDAGDHRIVWTYRPTSFRWGCLLSLVAAMAAIGHLWRQ